MKFSHLAFIIMLLALSLLCILFACSSGDDNDDSADDDDAADDDDVDDDDTADDDADDDDTADDDADDDDTADDDADDDDTADDDTADDDAVECETVIRGDLEWAQCDNGYDITQYDAVTYAETLELAGYDDWRLPTRAELKALYDEAYEYNSECYLPVHIVEPFVLSCSWVWTGEVMPGYDAIAWDVGFTHGSVTIELCDNSQNLRALPVRDL